MDSYLFLSLLALVVLVRTDKINDFIVPGLCPAVDEAKLWSEQLPNHQKFGGIWYQHSLTKNEYQTLEQCVRLNYAFDGQGYRATATGLNYNGVLQKRNGEIYPSSVGDPHLMVNFEGHSFPAPLVILDTDYSNYACLYSCLDHSQKFHSDFAFIFSRTPSLEQSYVRKCQKAFRNIGVDTNRFNKTFQGYKCPYQQQEEL